MNGSAWIAAARNGALDGASLLLEKLFMPSWGDASLGAITLFQGRVTPSKLSRTEISLNVKSELELLDTKLPRNFYQSSCLNTLFDAGCSLSKAAYAVHGEVTSASLTQITTTLTQAAGYFSLGTVTFDTGQNAGVMRSIRSYANGVITLATPLISTVAAGDSFTATPGCDKLQATCANKFNNVINFRGFPFVPDPETAV